MAGTPQPPKPPVVDEGLNDDIAARIDADSAMQDLQAENEPAGQATPPASPATPAPQEPDRIAALEQKFEEQQEVWNQERTQLVGALARAREQPIVVQPPAAPAAKPAPRSDEELIEALNKNPLGTVREIASNAAREAAAAVREELTGKVEGVRSETQRQAQIRTQVEQQYAEVKSEYSDIYADEKLAPQFEVECGTEMRRMNGEEWYKSFKPTDIGAVAAKVYARWMKSGKLNATQPNGGTNGSASLREIVRTAPPAHSDRSTSSAGAGRVGPAARSMADLGLTPTEQRAAAKVIKDMGLTEADYVANYMAAKRDNPNFGNG